MGGEFTRFGGVADSGFICGEGSRGHVGFEFTTFPILPLPLS